MNPVIDIKNLRKSFNRISILDGVNLEIPAGSVYGLLGRNGEGKTTLIKCILGLINPSEGSVQTLGENPLSFKEATKELIGYAPQADKLYPWLKAGEFLDYTASFYRSWNSDLVDRLVREWRVNKDKHIVTMSEGEAQKLSIIAALGHEPQLLVLDEPVSSLDPAMRRNFLKMIIELLASRSCTIFFSTHITSDLERITDKIGVLHEGKIKFSGSLDELKEKYQANLEDIFVEITK